MAECRLFQSHLEAWMLGTKIQDSMHRYGDAIQLIVKPSDDTFFWEFSIAPTGLWCCYFYNGPGSMVSKKTIDIKPVIKVTPQGSVNKICDRDTLWKVEASHIRTTYCI